jgi:hypothetical protein
MIGCTDNSWKTVTKLEEIKTYVDRVKPFDVTCKDHLDKDRMCSYENMCVSSSKPNKFFHFAEGSNWLGSKKKDLQVSEKTSIYEYSLPANTTVRNFYKWHFKKY